MKEKKKITAQIVFGLLLLIGLCIVALPTNAQKIQPSIPDGYSLIDGDILMPTTFVEAVLQGRMPEATYRTNLWTNGIVPFEFENVCAPTSTCTNAPNSGCVSAANQTAMVNQMAVLEAAANVDFQRCPGDDCIGNYIYIRDSTNDTAVGPNNSCVNTSANSSQVGMIGGFQTLNLVNWNTPGSPFIPVHELLHALGFYHEHTRPDRNTFVTVNCANVQGGCNGTIFPVNFNIPNDASAYGAYDFDSVMHYGQCAFTTGANCPTDNTRTITVNEPWNTQWQNAIGQLTRLSVLDQATVSFLYPFANWRFLDCTYNGSNGPPNGTFRQPYTTLSVALANTPAGGTLWITGPCNSGGTGTYGSPVTIRVAPNITANFGG